MLIAVYAIPRVLKNLPDQPLDDRGPVLLGHLIINDVVNNHAQGIGLNQYCCAAGIDTLEHPATVLCLTNKVCDGIGQSLLLAG